MQVGELTTRLPNMDSQMWQTSEVTVPKFSDLLMTKPPEEHSTMKVLTLSSVF